MNPNPLASIPTTNAPYSDLPPAFSWLFAAKARKGLTFEDIGKAINKDEVWVAALFYGQAKATEDELRNLFNVFGVVHDSVGTDRVIAQLGSHWYPNRGIGPIPPTDPVIYRLFEGVLV